MHGPRLTTGRLMAVIAAVGVLLAILREPSGPGSLLTAIVLLILGNSAYRMVRAGFGTPQGPPGAEVESVRIRSPSP